MALHKNLSKSMLTISEQLADLEKLLSGFRKSVDIVVIDPPTTCGGWRICLSDLLMSSMKLYISYLYLTAEVPQFVVKDGPCGHINTDVDREATLRRALEHELTKSDAWQLFLPETALSSAIGLRTTRDYFDRYILHLPEIYEEIKRIEEYLARCSSDKLECLDEILISLQHTCLNHICFVLQALAFAVEESNWRE